MNDEELYLLWSKEHCIWWRADGCGYTTDVMHAGLYPKAEAERRQHTRSPMRDGSPAELAVPLSEALAKHAEYGERTVGALIESQRATLARDTERLDWLSIIDRDSEFPNHHLVECWPGEQEWRAYNRRTKDAQEPLLIANTFRAAIDEAMANATCDECGGDGEFESDDEDATSPTTCKHCGGTGMVSALPTTRHMVTSNG